MTTQQMQMKPPADGPSLIRIIGWSPLMFTEPTVYPLSMMLEGCLPAIPPSDLVHFHCLGVSLKPSLFAFLSTLCDSEKNASTSSSVT